MRNVLHDDMHTHEKFTYTLTMSQNSAASIETGGATIKFISSGISTDLSRSETFRKGDGGLSTGPSIEHLNPELCIATADGVLPSTLKVFTAEFLEKPST